MSYFDYSQKASLSKTSLTMKYEQHTSFNIVPKATWSNASYLIENSLTKTTFDKKP